MFTVTLQCKDATDLRLQLAQLTEDLCHKVTHTSPQMELPFTEPAPAIPVGGKEDVKAFDLNVTKKGKGKGKGKTAAAAKPEPDVFKDEPAEEESAANESPAVMQTMPKATASKEGVAEVLQQVNITCGLPKAREILESFKAKRLSEIKEDQYTAFVAKCHEALMMN